MVDRHRNRLGLNQSERRVSGDQPRVNVQSLGVDHRRVFNLRVIALANVGDPPFAEDDVAVGQRWA